MKKRNIFLIFMLIPVLIIGILAYKILLASDNPAKEDSIEVLKELTIDESSKKVLDKLMKEVNVSLENYDFTIKSIYSDGIRFYGLLESVNSEELLEIKNSKIFINNVNEEVDSAIIDYIYSDLGKNYENQVLIICNNFMLKDNTDYYIKIYDEKETEYKSLPFKLETSSITLNKIVNKFFEEVYIKNITIAETSTRLEFDLHALIDVSNFKIDTGDSIISCEYKENKKDSYKVIFPVKIKEDQIFKLVIINSDGNVAAKIPIDLKK